MKRVSVSVVTGQPPCLSGVLTTGEHTDTQSYPFMPLATALTCQSAWSRRTNESPVWPWAEKERQL